MANLTESRVRAMSLGDFNIAPGEIEIESLEVNLSSGLPDDGLDEEPSPLPEDHPLLEKTRNALEMGYAGVIFSGPPGTGKSWYADKIARSLAKNPNSVVAVQFHASYQYEDFMEGYAPKDEGGFKLADRTFKLQCEAASNNPDTLHVLVIDEISRCDVARVFGEALTYLENDKRGRSFTLASGKTLEVPANLVILATMNPWDKGVDEVDVALERRFAQIDMLPSTSELRQMLVAQGAPEDFVDRLVRFFGFVQGLDEDTVHLGHAYFRNCVNEDRAESAWELRLRHFFKRACRLSPELFKQIDKEWKKVVPPPVVSANSDTKLEGVSAQDTTAAQSNPDEV